MSKDCTKLREDGPKLNQDAAKLSQDGDKLGRDGSKWSPDGAKGRASGTIDSHAALDLAPGGPKRSAKLEKRRKIKNMLFKPLFLFWKIRNLIKTQNAYSFGLLQKHEKVVLVPRFL